MEKLHVAALVNVIMAFRPRDVFDQPLNTKTTAK